MDVVAVTTFEFYLILLGANILKTSYTWREVLIVYMRITDSININCYLYLISMNMHTHMPNDHPVVIPPWTLSKALLKEGSALEVPALGGLPLDIGRSEINLQICFKHALQNTLPFVVTNSCQLMLEVRGLLDFHVKS